MNKSDYDQFKNLWGTMQIAYGKTPPPAVVQLDFNTLKDYSLDQVANALVQHRKTGSFAPQPSDIIRIVEGDPESIALEAYQKATKALSSVGKYRSPVFDDRRLQATIGRLGGWFKLCAMDINEWKFQKKDFVTIYNSLPVDIEPPVLIGLHDSQNGTVLAPQNTVLVGNQSEASALLESVKLLESKQ